MLKFYNIENRIQGITTDNASANFKFLEYLQDLIGDNFSKVENHFLCFGHILNLAAQDFIKTLNLEQSYDNDNECVLYLDDPDSDLGDEDSDIPDNADTDKPLEKLRSLLKKINKSEQLQIKFKNCCDTVGIVCTKPIIDVCTRWNSTFDMLTWSVKYKLSLNILCDTNQNTLSQFKIVENDWNLIGYIVKYLKPFKTLSNLLAGEKYCTLSMVVLGVNLLLDKLEQWAFALDTPNRTVSEESIIMALNASRNKILKHYDKTNWMYCVSLILDPRHKKEAFQLTCWGRSLEERSMAKFEEVLKNNYFEPTMCKPSDSSTPSVSSSVNEFDIDFNSIFVTSEDEHSGSFGSSSSNVYSDSGFQNELQNYLSMQRVNDKTDILAWWQSHSTIFPVLSRMTRDFFCTPATSVPAERLFSKAALVIRKHRNRLNSESVRSLICLNSWLDEFP